MSSKLIFPAKHPTSELDYIVDFAPKTNNNGVSNWLSEGESIVSSTVTSHEDLTLSEPEIINNGRSVRFWVSGGIVDLEYKITCQIITNKSPPRKKTQVLILPIKE